MNKLPSLASFSLFSSFGAIDRILQKIQGFKRWTSGVGSDCCSTNVATTTAQIITIFIILLVHLGNRTKFLVNRTSNGFGFKFVFLELVISEPFPTSFAFINWAKLIWKIIHIMITKVAITPRRTTRRKMVVYLQTKMFSWKQMAKSTA